MGADPNLNTDPWLEIERAVKRIAEYHGLRVGFIRFEWAPGCVGEQSVLLSYSADIAKDLWP